jgi:hypothetical protein
MPTLGQTLCQLEKTYSNQWLGSSVKIFTAEVARKEEKNQDVVAGQRQNSCEI